jgi:3-oxoacyl-[acyl-carrier protein] reductase
VNYAKNQTAAESTVAEIERSGGVAFTVGVELGTIASVNKFFEDLDQELNRRAGCNNFDILVNNAGIVANSPIDSASEKTFDELFNLNVKVPFFIAQKALTRLRKDARIINISSIVTRVALPQIAAYAMTKGALNILTLELAKQLGSNGITANSVSPGVTDTDMSRQSLRDPQFRQFAVSASALGRIGKPDDISEIVAFLASKEARWITGQNIDATGGFQL